MCNRLQFLGLAALVLGLGILAPAMGGSGLTQSYPEYHAVVDWGSKMATVNGYAPAKKYSTAAAARRVKAAALANACDNFASLATKIVPIRETGKRRAAMVAVARRLAAGKVIGGKKILDGRHLVTLKVPLTGKAGLSGALGALLWKMDRPELTESVALAERTESWEKATRDLPPLTGEEELLTSPDAKGPFTGLIVDARGFNVEASMAPVVYDAGNAQVYTGSTASLDYVEAEGVVAYARTLKAAVASDRAGKNPLVQRAVGTPDVFRRCVSLSDEDAKRVVAADKEKGAGFLAKCAVIFVIDPR